MLYLFIVKKVHNFPGTGTVNILAEVK